MRPVQLLHVALAALSASALSGCYQMYGGYPYGASPYGASPYGASPYGAPGMYQPGVQTLTPGAPYVPGGTTAPGSAPPSTFGSPGGLQPIPNNNGSGSTAPNYNGNEVNVPDPYMQRPSTSTQFPPANNGIQPVSGNDFSEPAALQPLSGELREVRQAAPTTTAAAPFGNSPAPAASNPFPGSNAQAEPANEFFAPVQTNTPPAAGASPFVPKATNPPAAQDIFGAELRKVDVSHVEYGHDPEYRWLQGCVSKDGDGSWSITFDDNPGPSDPHGGNLPLSDSPGLANLKDGQFVRLTGEVDPVVKDAHGKAMYVISSIAERVTE